MFLFKKKSSVVEIQGQQSEEREEDGFLVIGETHDEKSIVKPDDLINHEKPPGYQTLPTASNEYTSFKSQSPNSQLNSNEPSQSSKQTASNSDTAVSHLSNHQVGNRHEKHDGASAIKDIPFRFSGAVQTAANHGRQNWDIGDIMPNVWSDLSEYNYSFKTEYDVLE